MFRQWWFVFPQVNIILFLLFLMFPWLDFVCFLHRNVFILWVCNVRWVFLFHLQGAAMLSLSDFTSHTCLAVTHLYTNEDIFVTSVITSKVKPACTFCLYLSVGTCLYTCEDIFVTLVIISKEKQACIFWPSVLVHICTPVSMSTSLSHLSPPVR